MPRGDRTAHKDLAAVKLASGGTVAEAASAAGVDERTVYKWKSGDSKFRTRIADLRAQMVAAALGKLSDAMSAAADALVALVAHADEDVRHRAAVKVIELALKVRSDTEIEERLAAVERTLKGDGDGGHQSATEEDRGEGEGSKGCGAG